MVCVQMYECTTTLPSVSPMMMIVLVPFALVSLSRLKKE